MSGQYTQGLIQPDRVRVDELTRRTDWYQVAWAAIDPENRHATGGELPYVNNIRSGIRVYHQGFGSTINTIHVARSHTPNDGAIDTMNWVNEAEWFLDMPKAIDSDADTRPMTPALSNWTDGVSPFNGMRGFMEFEWIARDGNPRDRGTLTPGQTFVIRVWRLLANRPLLEG